MPRVAAFHDPTDWHGGKTFRQSAAKPCSELDHGSFNGGVTGVPPVNMGVFEVCSFAARGDWGGFV